MREGVKYLLKQQAFYVQGLVGERGIFVRWVQILLGLGFFYFSLYEGVGFSFIYVLGSVQVSGKCQDLFICVNNFILQLLLRVFCVQGWINYYGFYDLQVGIVILSSYLRRSVFIFCFFVLVLIRKVYLIVKNG